MISAGSTATIDEVLLQSVELAREAAELESGGLGVGDHVGAQMEGEHIATQRFTCTNPGYVGWEWSVVVARPDAGADPTVCEVVLMPGAQALIAPEWVPWSARIQPGDLGVGDVLPTPADDPRLVPGFTDVDALEGLASLAPLQPGTWELGLGRARVLSLQGRDEAVERWLAAETGPESAMARAAELNCTTCGFLVMIGGPLGQAFGICANLMSPADGAVVALDFGCGAHSEVEAHDQPISPEEVDHPELAQETDLSESSELVESSEPIDSEPDEPLDEHHELVET